MERCQNIVVTGCLLKGGRVLLVRRAETEKFLPGYYEMPGGKCDFGEDPEEALRREFLEEVGLEIASGKPFKTFSYITDGGNRHTVEIVFRVESHGYSESINLGKDHTAFVWSTKEELKNYLITDEMLDSVVRGFDE